MNVCNRPVVVIGGGEVGLAKIRGLLEAGALVIVVDPDPVDGVRRLASSKKIRWIKRRYRKGDLARAVLAVTATDDRLVNRAACEEAKRRGIFLNAVDKPEYCTFTVPAKIRRGEFLLTISTGGLAPALSKKLREDLEKRFGPEYGELVKVLGRLRGRLKRQKIPGREKVLNALVRSPLLAYIRSGDRQAIRGLLNKIL